MTNATTTIAPAVSTLALPSLRRALDIEIARCKLPVYADLCGDIRTNLERQIAAALTGAATWTDTNGTVWGAGGLRVGGVAPCGGGNSFAEPLGY